MDGTWDSTPYHRIVRAHRLNEFMYLLDGSVRFAAPDGSVLSAVTGDALFVPQGAPIVPAPQTPAPSDAETQVIR